MSTIKKAYVSLIDLLQASADMLVSDILPQAIELASAKTGAGGGKATTFHKNEAGETVAIKDYYFGLWFDPRVVDFGVKASSPTGLSNMSKEGTSKWNKGQAAFKKATASLLDRVTAGELAVEDIASEKDRLAEEAKEIVAFEAIPGYGFETLEDCLADSAERGLA